MILWRLNEDAFGLLEGSCLSDSTYKAIPWFQRSVLDPIDQEERVTMIEHEDEEYCRDNGVECLLFFDQRGLDNFMKKAYDIGID